MKSDRDDFAAASDSRAPAGRKGSRDMESDSSRTHDAGTTTGQREASLEELVAYLRQQRSELREQWASRIRDHV